MHVDYYGPCFQNLGTWVDGVKGEPAAQAALGLVLGVSAILFVVTRIGEKRWIAAGISLDGDED